MKNKKLVLLTNTSNQDISCLNDIFEELERFKINFRLLGNADNRLKKFFKEKNWLISRALVGPNWIYKNSFFFLIFYPIAFLPVFFYLLFWRFFKKYHYLILIGKREKILWGIAAKILNFNTIRFELPSSKNKLGYILKFFYNLNLRLATKIAIWNGLEKSRLKTLGLKEEKIIYLPPTFNFDRLKQQANIFENIAGGQQENKKFFTVGLLNPLEGVLEIKTLLTTIAKTLELIPNLHILVISDKDEKSKLAWIAENIGLKNIIWFMRTEDNPKKWLSGLDILLINRHFLKIDDLSHALSALASDVIVLGYKYSGLEEIFPPLHRLNPLVDSNDPEELTQKIIEIHQKPIDKKYFCENAKKQIKQEFYPTKTVLKFLELF